MASVWPKRGWIRARPEPFTLAELGPGRGTLMADALRAAAQVPGFVKAAQVTLVEASPALRALQRERLPKAAHLDAVHDLPEAPLFLIANEFFDALPIRQFQRAENGWRECVVTTDGTALSPALTDPAPIAALAHRLDDTSLGDMVETCPAAAPIMSVIGDRIARYGGAALIVDYGDWRSQGDTLQAVQNHEPTDPFAAPGQADLTAHVDFEALANAAAPARPTRLTPQGVFLERLGITQRAQHLARSMGGDVLEAHIAAHHRLTHPAQMGHLFKVMGLFAKGAAPPPGLET